MSAYYVLSLFPALCLYEFCIPSNNGLKQDIIVLVYRQRNLGTERSDDLPKVTQ